MTDDEQYGTPFSWAETAGALAKWADEHPEGQTVPLTDRREGHDGEVIGEATVTPTPDGAEVLARVKGWMAEQIAPPDRGGYSVAFAPEALDQLRDADRYRDGHRLDEPPTLFAGIPVVASDLVEPGRVYVMPANGTPDVEGRFESIGYLERFAPGLGVELSAWQYGLLTSVSSSARLSFTLPRSSVNARAIAALFGIPPRLLEGETRTRSAMHAAYRRRTRHRNRRRTR